MARGGADNRGRLHSPTSSTSILLRDGPRCPDVCAPLRQPVAWALLTLFAIGALASLIASAAVRQSRSESEQEDARAEAVEMATRLVDALGGYERSLHMMAASAEGLVLARGGLGGGVPFDAYAVVATNFLETLQGTSTGGSFLVRVPAALRAEFEANATRDAAVALNRTAVVVHAGKTDVPAPNTTDTYPVVAAATTPVTAGPRKFLFFMDLVSIPDGGMRRRAVETAMRTGIVTATPPVDLFGNFGGLGYIFYARVGGIGSGLDGQSAMGVVLTAVPSQQLVATLLGAGEGVADSLSPGFSSRLSSDGRVLLLLVDDITDESKPSRLVEYWSDGGGADRHLADASLQMLRSQIYFAGRAWLLRINMRKTDFDRRVNDGTAVIVLAAGLLCSLLAVVVIALAVFASRRRLRLRVAQARAWAEAQTHAKLVSYICHELRNPLHHLRAGFQLFSEDHAVLLTARMSQELSLLSMSVEQMHHVVNDILDMRNLDAGDVHLEPRPCDVRAVVRDLTNQLRDAVGAHVTLRVVSSKTLPAVLVTDPMRLRQVVGNAIHNAAKFTAAGRIDVIVRMFGGKRWLLVEVRNTGVGLGDKDPDMLLGKFGSDVIDVELPETPSGRFSPSTRLGRSPRRSRVYVATPKPAKPARAWVGSIPDELYEWFDASVSTEEGREIELPEAVASDFGQFVVSRSDHGSGEFDNDSLYSRTHGAISPTGSSSDAPPTGVSTLFNATGLGLGLPLCRRIVERAGGHIGLADVAGFTRWWMAIPVGESTEPDSARAAAGGAGAVSGAARGGVGAGAASGGAGSGGGEARAAPHAVGSATESKEGAEFASMHVCAVDDESLLRKIAKRWLMRLGVQHTVLDDGELLEGAMEAAAAKGAPISCVLLDIVMLRSDGSEVCRKLRAAGVTVPIYAMTGNVDDTNVHKYKSVGFNGILGKPFGITDVGAALEHARRGERSFLSRITRNSYSAAERADARASGAADGAGGGAAATSGEVVLTVDTS